MLLAQALFSNPDILLLDEPTNNTDIDTIRWLEQTLNDRDSTMIIISHDRHFLNMVCTHMADLDYGELRVYPGNYDEYMTAATQHVNVCWPTTPRRKRRLRTCNPSSAASAPTPLSRVRRPRVRVRSTKSSWKRLKPPAVRTRSSASSRTRSCSVTRWKWKPSPKASMKARCSKLQPAAGSGREDCHPRRQRRG